MDKISNGFIPFVNNKLMDLNEVLITFQNNGERRTTRRGRLLNEDHGDLSGIDKNPDFVIERNVKFQKITTQK